MRPIVVILLLFVCGCTKDTILLEQVNVDIKAITDFTGNCAELHAEMLSESDIRVYSQPYSLFTEDDFETLSYDESSQTVSNCGSEVMFFDGITTWLRAPYPFPIQLERYSFDGKPFLVLQGDYSEFTFTPPVFSDTKTRLPYFFDDNRIMIGTKAFGSAAAQVYEADATLKTATLVGTTHILPFYFTPMSIHRAGNTWLLVGYDNLDSRDYSVVTSPDLTNWEGPFTMAELPSTDFWIDQTDGQGDLMVARGVNQNFTTSHDPGINNDHLYLVSVDKGHTWSPLAPSMNILHAQVLGNGMIYAVVRQEFGDRGTISKLAKSSDNGATWTTENPLFYGDRISFHDPSHGIAMTGATLQVTHDGGKSWTLLLTTPY